MINADPFEIAEAVGGGTPNPRRPPPMTTIDNGRVPIKSGLG